MLINSRSVAALVIFVTACAVDGGLDPEHGETTAASTVANGQNLNGQNLNGQNLNGQNLNGQNLNGPDNGSFTIWTSLEGIRLQGATMDSASLNATVFTAVKGSNVRTGTALAGAELVAMRGDGRAVAVRLSEIIPAPAGSTTWRYLVDYREDDGVWYPLCENASGPIAAIPLEGTWDHRQGVAGGGAHVDDPTKFTFACEGQGALGKCVGIGYAPWSTSADVALAGHHQACVRLMRGDFCGDGTPHTKDGNRVNLYDGLGIQQDTEAWVFEAEWDAGGARCFYPANRSQERLACYQAKLRLDCGELSHFSSGTLLMNETPTSGVSP